MKFQYFIKVTSLGRTNGWKDMNLKTRKVCWIGCWAWTDQLRSNVPPLTDSTTIRSCRNRALSVNSSFPFIRWNLFKLIFWQDTRMLRRSPAQYADGVFEPSGADRPNPLIVSRLLMSDDNASPGSVSKTGKTALLVFFGTFHVKNELKHIFLI